MNGRLSTVPCGAPNGQNKLRLPLSLLNSRHCGGYSADVRPLAGPIVDRDGMQHPGEVAITAGEPDTPMRRGVVNPVPDEDGCSASPRVNLAQSTRRRPPVVPRRVPVRAIAGEERSPRHQDDEEDPPPRRN